MPQPTPARGIDTFNHVDCFRFWYEDLPFEQLASTLKRPSFRQCLFLMSLVSALQSPLSRYEVVFPYADSLRFQYLLKPKKRFYQSISPDDLQQLIETLKGLPRQLQWYRQYPSVNGYFQLEEAFKIVLRYFSIPKEKTFFERLHDQVPASEWKVHEAKEAAKQLAQKQAEQLERWTQRQGEALNKALQPVDIEDHILSQSLTRFKRTESSSIHWIKAETQNQLTTRYYETLAWLQLLSPDDSLPVSSHSDQWMHYLTEPEAKTWGTLLSELIQPLKNEAIILKQRPLTVGLSSQLRVHPQWYQLLYQMGEVFPYLKDFYFQIPKEKVSATATFDSSLLFSVEKLVSQFTLKWTRFKQEVGIQPAVTPETSLSQSFILVLSLQSHLQAQFKPEIDDFSDLFNKEMLQDWLQSSCFLPDLPMESLCSLAEDLQEVVHSDWESYQRQQAILDEMNHLLETLPKAPVTLQALRLQEQELGS